MPRTRAFPIARPVRAPVLLHMRRILLSLLLTSPPAGAATTVRVEVASDWRPAGLALTLVTTWLGEPVEVALRDDGQPPDDRGGDGVWTATMQGDEVRALSLSLRARTADSPDDFELWSGFEPLPMGEQSLALAIDDRGRRPVARRTSLALPMRQLEIAEASSVAAMFGWAGLIMVYGIGLAAIQVSRRRR